SMALATPEVAEPRKPDWGPFSRMVLPRELIFSPTVDTASPALPATLEATSLALSATLAATSLALSIRPDPVSWPFVPAAASLLLSRSSPLLWVCPDVLLEPAMIALLSFGASSARARDGLTTPGNWGGVKHVDGTREDSRVLVIPFASPVP